MKPAPFVYTAPTTLDEALALLGENVGLATPLAGGQSLVPAMNFRLAAPEMVVDINLVDELTGIEENDDGMRIGAITRHQEIIDSGVVADRCPILAAAARHIGHIPIRNRGTLGGTVAHADPAAEIPGVAVLLGGTIELASLGGTRRVPAEEFSLGPYFTTRDPQELVTAVSFPALSTPSWGFHEVVRSAGDFALAGAAVALDLEDGAVRAARVAVFGVEAAPRRLAEVESALCGQPVADAARTAAEATHAAALELLSDPRMPADYRRQLAATAVSRAVIQAVARGDAP